MRRQDEEHLELIGPEELVKRETKVVNMLRALLISILVITATLLSLGCYKLTSKWEEEAYRRDFNLISLRFMSSFHAALAQVMWNAYIIGVAASASTNLGKGAPNITIPLFDKIPFAVNILDRVANVFFAPLLHDEEELHGWEHYAQQQLNQSEQVGANSKCEPCGNPNLDIGTPNRKVELPVGIYTCHDLNSFGLSGMIPAEECSLLTQYVKANCDCRSKSGVALTTAPVTAHTRSRSNQIFEISGNGTQIVEGSGPYSPIWQVYPPNNANAFVMYDLFSEPIARTTLETMVATKTTLISETYDRRTPNLWNVLEGGQPPTWGNLMFSPVFGASGKNVIGTIVLDFDFKYLIGASVPVESNGICIVLENSCGQTRTFRSDGNQIDVVGDGDLHNPRYTSIMQSSSFEDYLKLQRATSPNDKGDYNGKQNCAYRILVYSSDEFRSTYISNKPRLYAATVVLIFVFTTLVFVAYDCYVARRQKNLMEAALQRDEIVSSLFPAAVRARLFGVGQQSIARPAALLAKSSLSSWIAGAILPSRQVPAVFRPSLETTAISDLKRSEPIADFLPMVSVVFADLSGFTAWSSEREPSQVFQLLETLFQAIDKIARQFDVFKIETIGDCYVAATCIPVYQPDHAVRVVKFAQSCLLQVHELIHDLETTLGPSTSSLSIRIGIHSGPVIAGVLRGEKSRFQLFGDTMNTAARMQTTCETNMIQISSATANLLTEAQMRHWIKPRNEAVTLKGKGAVQTFWLNVLSEHADVSRRKLLSEDVSVRETSRPWGDTRPSDRLSSKMSAEDKQRRMVEWNTDLLLRFLKKIVANRITTNRSRAFQVDGKSSTSSIPNVSPVAEATEILAMPGFLERANRGEIDPELMDLGDAIRSQLHDYITEIAAMYHDNPFHNFEHACHVTMSAAKIVMRIIRPNVDSPNVSLAKGKLELERKIHQCTFGISSNVMMQFAVVFSAVIHDVDHSGVSNAQLVKEGNDVARRYDNKCVAEQNSVDIAWNLLMQDQYDELRNCICPTALEQKRFRQLLVNAVIATDIADKELQQRRKIRWDRAFHSETSICSEDKNDTDRKATIVFEYIIQASDVSHTMQHWKVYNQWNERLFEERYRAFQSGREEQDPSIGWYMGELWFFDNYIIPLAKKLETCGVFGVSSDEYLSYAMENRHEWELKGEEIVSNMVNKFNPTKVAHSLGDAHELDV